MMGLVIVILIISILTLFWPDSSNDGVSSAPAAPPAHQNPDSIKPETAVNKEATQLDQHAQQMKAEFELLEQSRRELKRTLARLKHEMWGMEFPPEQAREINEIMLNAHKFEKTPRMLGAFHNSEEIRDEREKVLFAIKSLEEVETGLQQNSSNMPVSE